SLAGNGLKRKVEFEKQEATQGSPSTPGNCRKIPISLIDPISTRSWSHCGRSQRRALAPVSPQQLLVWHGCWGVRVRRQGTAPSHVALLRSPASAAEGHSAAL